MMQYTCNVPVLICIVVSLLKSPVGFLLQEVVKCQGWKVEIVQQFIVSLFLSLSLCVSFSFLSASLVQDLLSFPFPLSFAFLFLFFVVV